MTRVFACLWKGENLPKYSEDVYDVAYVDRFVAGVHRTTCATPWVLVDAHYTEKLIHRDKQFGHVTLTPMCGHGVGGWSNVLELFRPSLWPTQGERFMAVGLDTVFVKDCSWLFDWDRSPVGIPLDPYESPVPCDAVITWDREGAELVWNEFQESRKDGMKRHLYGGKPSEMVLLRDLYARHGWKPLEEKPSKLLSYKRHYTRWENPDPDIVYFHGRPKPADLPVHNPVRKIWEAR